MSLLKSNKKIEKINLDFDQINVDELKKLSCFQTIKFKVF